MRERERPKPRPVKPPTPKLTREQERRFARKAEREALLRAAKPKERIVEKLPAKKSVQESKLSPAQLRRAARERFLRARKAGDAFNRQLTKLGQRIGSLVEVYAPGGEVRDMRALQIALNNYSQTLRPWAESIVKALHAEVEQRDGKAWFEMAKEMGKSIRKEIEKAPTGQAMRTMLGEQVDLITSLPKEAGQRVHRLTIEGLITGRRANEIAEEISKTEEVSVSRARLIARTETARTASVLTQSRAQWLGSEGYIWRTSMDPMVRPALHLPAKQRAHFIGSHRKLEGTFHKWTEPPVSGQRGERAHPGQIYNCRCWPEPVLPDHIA